MSSDSQGSHLVPIPNASIPYDSHISRPTGQHLSHSARNDTEAHRPTTASSSLDSNGPSRFSSPALSALTPSSATFPPPTPETRFSSRPPNSPASGEVINFMSRWRVVTTNPSFGGSCDGIGVTTTIDAQSPYSASRTTGFGRMNSNMPYFFENGEPDGQHSPSLKRKFRDISRDANGRSGGAASGSGDPITVASRSYASILEEEAIAFDRSPVDAGQGKGKEPAHSSLVGSVSSRAPSTGHLFTSRAVGVPVTPPRPTYSPRGLSSAPRPLQNSNVLHSRRDFGRIPAAQNGGINTPIQLVKADAATRSTPAPIPGAQYSGERSPISSRGSSSGSSLGADQDWGLADLGPLKGGAEIFQLEQPRREIFYEKQSLRHQLPDVNSSSCPSSIVPLFSYLHEEVWFEEAMAREEMAEQQEAFNNQGKCLSSITRVNKVPPKSQPAMTRTAPKCKRHSAAPSPYATQQDGCESDCFEEYDPLDDVSELRAALEKLERDTKERVKRPTNQREQEQYQRKAIKSSRKGKGDDTSRRPYLSYTARSLLPDLEHDGRLDSLIGTRIHVSFTKQEATRVWLTIYIACPNASSEIFSVWATANSLRVFLSSPDYSKEEKQALLAAVASEAASRLAGRTAADISNYIGDVLELLIEPLSSAEEVKVEPRKRSRTTISWPFLILSRELAGDGSMRSLAVSHNEVQETANRESLLLIKPYRKFTEGSSDVVDCAWDSTGRNFALACTTYNDMYNRPGNLMLGNVEGSIKFLCGHQTPRPANQGNGQILDPYLHSTVSSVDFSGGLLYSSSFDKTVKIWGVKDRELRRSLAFPAPVVRMKMHSKLENLGAGCLQNGDVVVFRPFLSGNDEEGLDTSQVFHASQDYLEPSSILWTSAKARNSWLFVGYDNKESDKRQLNAHFGDLRVYDAIRGVEIGGIKPGSTRQFDICLDESEQLLVAGAIAGVANRPSPDTFSHVRVWDLRLSLRKTYEFSCRHKDINKVTISPCNTYVTSSGTNGKSYLWDLRYGVEPLHTLEHGESKTPLNSERDREEIDTGVTFASWAANGSLLVTGSSDGLVKVWDPARAEPFLYTLAVLDDPVMSGAFSPDGDSLIIGETTGKATLFSYMGRHGPPEPFVQDRTMLAPTASEEEEEISGVESAKELVRTGQVVLVSEDGGRPSVYGR
ncbi:hypothetical protein ABW19_dt0200148 [Dactylella cylindrospora]|nr:hypothetical protein ABW19_dt0200148 [Dactylella cylindrospora]